MNDILGGILAGLLGGGLGLLVVLWGGVWHWKHRRHTAAIRRMGPPVGGKWAPRVVVCVPARNEERAVGRAVRSLLAQTYQHLRIIVADDGSTDRTPEILRELRSNDGDRLVVLRVPDPPPGWMGKCHALHRAVAVAPADAEYLLFCDADVIHRPDTVARAVAEARRTRAGLLALMPRVDCVGFWENAILPMFMHLGLVQLDPRHLNNPRRREIAGIGAFTLIRQDVYTRIGGHEAIRGETIDDMALAQNAKQSGARLVLRSGADAIHLRMYSSFSDIFRGFQKNMYAAFGSHPGRALNGAVLLALVHVMPVVSAIAGVVIGSLPLALAGVALWLYIGLAIAERTGRTMRHRPWMIVAGYPAGALVASAMLLRSMWLAERHGVVHWRGRRLNRPPQRVRLV